MSDNELKEYLEINHIKSNDVFIDLNNFLEKTIDNYSSLMNSLYEQDDQRWIHKNERMMAFMTTQNILDCLIKKHTVDPSKERF
jgi:hypothetical protein